MLFSVSLSVSLSASLSTSLSFCLSVSLSVSHSCSRAVLPSELTVEQLYTMLSTQMLSAGGGSLEKPVSFALVEQLAAAASVSASSSISSGAEPGPAPETATYTLLEALVEAFVLGRNEQEEEVTAPTPTATSPMEVEPLERKEQEEGESPLKRARLDSPDLTGSGLEGSKEGEGGARRREGSRFSSSSTPPEEEQGGRDEAPSSLQAVSLLDLGDLASLSASAAKEHSVSTLAALLAGFRDRPTLLFSAPHKEPLLSGFSNLDATLIGGIRRSHSLSAEGWEEKATHSHCHFDGFEL